MKLEYIITGFIFLSLVCLVYVVIKQSEKEEIESKKVTEDIVAECDKKNVSEYPKNLKEWLIYAKSKNLTKDELVHIIMNDFHCDYEEVYVKLKGGEGPQRKADYLYRQWNRPKPVKKNNINQFNK